MAWIRLSDDYNDHPKFDNLSDGAFRLWHQGMGFCRKYKTDGLIPTTTLRKFKAYSSKRARELETPWQAGAEPLWHVVDGFGTRVHDYLEWNPSKDEDNERRDGSKERMRQLREDRKHVGVPPVTPLVTQLVSTNRVQTLETRSHNVLGWDGKGSVRTERDALDLRAGQLIERYAELFYEHRKGARYHNRMHHDFPKAQELVATWTDDARLEKLAVLVLTTDDDWISGTDRGFGIFAAKASWADGLLAEWEAKNKASV